MRRPNFKTLGKFSVFPLSCMARHVRALAMMRNPTSPSAVDTPLLPALLHSIGPLTIPIDCSTTGLKERRLEHGLQQSDAQFSGFSCASASWNGVRAVERREHGGEWRRVVRLRCKLS
jgi:hypothetical protein